MKIKNRLNTNTNRTIKKSFARFLSLMVMSLLGVLVYVGLTSTSPDMINTIDKFFDEQNTYDIKIISTMGLKDDDIESLKKINNIKDIEGIYSKDVLIKKNDNEFVLNISSLPKTINLLTLIDGHLPENDKEIVVEENLLTKLGYKLNDKLTISNEVFINQEVTIVGTIRSPLYFTNTKIKQNRGTTTIGSGVINYYSYVLPSNFDIDYYNYIYLTINNATDEITSKDKYINLVDEASASIEKIKGVQEDNRYNSIYDEITDEISNNEEKANEELQNTKKELDKAKKELDKAKKKLDTAKKNLSDGKEKLDKGKKDIEDGKKTLSESLKKYKITNIDTTLKEVNDNIKEIENKLPSLKDNQPLYQEYSKKLNTLKEQQTLLNNLKTLSKKITNGEAEYNRYNKIYQESSKKYQEMLKEYDKNLKIYNDNYDEYLKAKEEVEQEIVDAKEEAASLEKPKWYIYTRADDQTYASYIKQAKSINNLAKIFPVVFYAVAILVSLISMNRMVEDDRGEIGTLKSLGFTNYEIKQKYITFSLIATIIGGIIGTIIGSLFIPYVIFNIYKLLFDIPNLQFSLNIVSTLVGISIAIICICGSSIITANKILKEKPANLMRPKVPKSGKKVLLEKIKWLWGHLKFSNKITIRNLFRYKKRVFVTIIGICGCTALMLCGFGIKDSIVDITNMQYVETFIYDATVYTNNLDLDNINAILDDNRIKDYTLSETITGTINDSNVSILVTENKDLSKIVKLVDRDTNESLSLDKNDVIITDKLSDLYNIKIGDEITILDSDKVEYKFNVTHIVKNYMGHYIYVNKETLEKNYNIFYKPNVIYLNTISLNEDEEDNLSNKLLDNESVVNVVHRRYLVNSVQDMLNSLDKVVVILVLLSAMLSFVVLYNLSNINIIERTREISTLKVLGFYDKEVDNYITKETIILTIVGIALGLIFGTYLTKIVISTVEMEEARFLRHIKLNSYIYSALISSIFTLIVNFVTHFTLKRINMIESLKSVE